MDVTAKFIEIIEQGDDNALIPFLKQLTEANKKKLKPVIKKTRRSFTS